MNWSTLITLALKYGPTAIELATKYGPLAAKVVEAVSPVVKDAVTNGPLAGAPVIDKINGVLQHLGHPEMTDEQVAHSRSVWDDHASGAPGSGFAGFQ